MVQVLTVALGLALSTGVILAQPLPESAHDPYPPSVSVTQTYAVPAAAAAIDVTFSSRTEFEAGADFLDVKNGSGQPIAGSPFTGLELAGRTVRVPGRTVVLVLRSDGSDPPGRQFYGYKVTDIAAAPSEPPTVLTTALPSGRVGSVYSVQFQAHGGVPPLSWLVLPSEPLPQGLTLQSSGLLVGIPTTATVSSFTVLVTDANDRPGQQRLSLRINPSGTGPYLRPVPGNPTADTLPVTIQLEQLPQGFPLLREVLAVLAFDPSYLRYQSFAPGSSAASPAARVLFSGLVGEGAFSTVILGEIGPTGPVGTAQFRTLQALPSAQADRDRLAFLTLTRLQTRDGEVIFRFPPTADAGFDQVVELDSRGRLSAPDPTLPVSQADRHRSWITLDGRRSVDPLGRPLTYYWRRANGTAAGLSAPGQTVTAFTTTEIGIHRFTLQVYNGETFSAPDRVTVRVEGPGKHSPTARATLRNTDRGFSATDLGAPLVAVQDDLLTFDGTTSADADLEDKDRLQYQWTAPGLVPDDRKTQAKPAFVAASPGTYSVELTVSDPSGLVSNPVRQQVIVRASALSVPKLSLTALTAETGKTGQELGNAAVPLARPESLEASLLTTVTLKATLTDSAMSVTPTYDFDWRVAEGPQAEMPQTTASVVNVRLTTPGVYLFECVAREVAAGHETGVTTRSQIRLLGKSRQVLVPVASARVSAPHAAKVTSLPGAAPVTVYQVQIGGVVQLDGTASLSRTTDTTVQTYRWHQVAGPQITLSDPTSPVTTFVAPDLRARAAQTLVFQLYVDDGRVRSEPDPVSVELLPSPPAEVQISVQHGLNLIGLTAEPIVEDALFRSVHLLQLTTASCVLRLTPGPDGRGKFEPLFPGPLGGTDFVLEAGRGVMLWNPGSAATLGPYQARAWSARARRLVLHRGLNVVVCPAGASLPWTAQTFCTRVRASFVARVPTASAAGRTFETYMPGIPTPSFTLEAGKAYLVGVPVPVEVGE